MWLFELFFLNSANLICRGTDISRYFRKSLGIRDNESRLYSQAVLAHSENCDSLDQSAISCSPTTHEQILKLLLFLHFLFMNLMPIIGNQTVVL